MPLSSDLNTKIQNMLDELPEPAAGERRAPLLTKHDARWLANLALVIAEHQPCSLGFHESHAESLKQMVKERRRLLAIVGTAVVTTLALVGKAALASIDPEFWKHFIQHLCGK
jgi:hypothetical protein